MPSSKDDLAEQLFETLEQCCKRLLAIREEVDGSIALVNVAMASVTQLRSSAALRGQFAELLEAQRAAIVQEVASLMAGTAGEARGPFRFSLDALQRTAKIGRRRIPLTRAEFKLLQCLWERQPRPASRRDLLDHLYGEDEQPSDAVIDVIIFKIRQKLRNAGCNDASIEVVRGEGWYLNLDPGLYEAGEPEADSRPVGSRSAESLPEPLP
jgi:DNA-binding winged helix-turn-helix (wHTH) protein